MQRLARQAIEEAIAAKRALKEQRKLELLKAGVGIVFLALRCITYSKVSYLLRNQC